MRIPESELVINGRGAVYHLNLKPDELAPIVITVGDPERVQQVTRHFNSIEVKQHHREFHAHTGWLGTKRISVISTGIGTDNIDIALNEVDALINIDLVERTIKPQSQSIKIIRIGTCGSLQHDIPVDSFVASTHGLGLDNLLNYYQHSNNEQEKNILQAFLAHTQVSERFSKPYVAGASAHMLKYFTDGFFHGITVTCPGFYGPQGRVLRLGLSSPELIDSLSNFQYGNHRITNFEMETSGLYGLGKLLGHHCISLSTVVANRKANKFTDNVNHSVERLIEKTLAIIETF